MKVSDKNINNHEHDKKRATVAYLIANIITKGISFITLPIYTRLLSTTDIGLSTVFSTWYSIFYAVFTLSLSSGSVSVAMADYRDERDKYMSACLSLSTLSSLVFGTILIVLHNMVEKLIGMPVSLFYLLLLLLIFQPSLDMWYIRKRFDYKYKSVLALSLFTSIGSSCVSIIAVFIAKMKAGSNLGEIKIVYQYTVILVVCIVIYAKTMYRGHCFFDASIWKYALAVSAPLVVHALAKSVLDVSDRLMIDMICGKEYAGIYGTVYGIGTAYFIVWTAINTAMVPMLFDDLRNEKRLELDSRVWNALCIISVIAIVSTVFAPEVLRILTVSEYYEGVYIIPAVSGGVYMTALYNIYSNFLLYSKKTSTIMLSTMLAAIINILLNSILIPRFGYIAAAYTTLISYFVLAFLQKKGMNKYYGKHLIKSTRVMVLSICTITGCLLCNLLYHLFLLRFAFLILCLTISFVHWKNNNKV